MTKRESNAPISRGSAPIFLPFSRRFFYFFYFLLKFFAAIFDEEGIKCKNITRVRANFSAIFVPLFLFFLLFAEIFRCGAWRRENQMDQYHEGPRQFFGDRRELKNIKSRSVRSDLDEASRATESQSKLRRSRVSAPIFWTHEGAKNTTITSVRFDLHEAFRLPKSE